MSLDTEEKILSPQDVRKILNADNKEIVDLCRKASVVPKKNNVGKTYFSEEDVKVLKKVAQKHVSVTNNQSQIVVNNLLQQLQQIENSITNAVSEKIDEKLDGMDEVVVELIRCKTENETLRQKINELNKENYTLKNSLNSYKPLIFNLFIKNDKNDFMI